MAPSFTARVAPSTGVRVRIAVVTVACAILAQPSRASVSVVITAAGGGTNYSTTLANPAGVTMSPSGSLVIADSYNNRVVQLTVPVNTTNATAAGLLVLVAGNGSGGYAGNGGPAINATLQLPIFCVFSAGGDLFIADSLNNVVRRVDSGTQVISTYAGLGLAAYGGDGHPATAAYLNAPSS